MTEKHDARASPPGQRQKRPKYKVSPSFLKGGELFSLTISREQSLEAPLDTTSTEQEDDEAEGDLRLVETRYEISIMLVLQVAIFIATVVAVVTAIAALS